MTNFTKFFTAFFTAGVILLSVPVKAQIFQVGTSAINLGIGFGYSVDYYGAGGSSTPVIGGSYEYGVTKLGPGTLGIGVAVGYQGASYSYSDGYGDSWSDKWSTTLFGIRGVYHPDFLRGAKYDVYAALQLSYLNYGFSETSSGPYTGVYNYGGNSLYSSFYPYIIIGGRYYFTNNFGVFAELGYSLAYLNIGVSLKFGGSGSSK